jgi:hypothetical protein
VRASQQQDILSRLKDFIIKGQDRLGNAWPPDLIVVFNYGNFNEASQSIDQVTAQWKQRITSVCLPFPPLALINLYY